MPSLDALHFFSENPIDKIVQSGEFTITNAGAISVTELNVVSQPRVRTVSDTETNSYGRAGLIRGRYSINGGEDWQEMESAVGFGFETDTYVDGSLLSSIFQADLRAQVALGSDDSNIYARFMSGYHNADPLRVDINTGAGTSTYSGWSAISQTVTIQYWLYERE